MLHTSTRFIPASVAAAVASLDHGKGAVYGFLNDGNLEDKLQEILNAVGALQSTVNALQTTVQGLQTTVDGLEYRLMNFEDNVDSRLCELDQDTDFIRKTVAGSRLVFVTSGMYTANLVEEANIISGTEMFGTSDGLEA